MTETVSANEAKITLAPAVKKQIDYWVAKYPADQKRSAILGALHAVQDANDGELTDAHIEAVAHYLDMEPVAAFEVATFYCMFDRKAVGRHKIYYCTNISCMLKGANELGEHIKKKLNVEYGETTADGKFTLKEFECLGACVQAPMCLIDKTYHTNLTPEKIDTILDEMD